MWREKVYSLFPSPFLPFFSMYTSENDMGMAWGPDGLREKEGVRYFPLSPCLGLAFSSSPHLVPLQRCGIGSMKGIPGSSLTNTPPQK